MSYQRIIITSRQRLFDVHNRTDDNVALAQQSGIKRTTASVVLPV